MQRIAWPKRGIASAFAGGLAAAILATVVAGCGSEPSHTMPAGCLEGPSAVRAALVRAPGQVRVGGRRLSACFPRAGSQGDVESLGVVFIAAAERLADQTVRQPGGPTALRLGYLIGAAHRGAGRAQGIYSELLRRLDSVADRIKSGRDALERGRAAGEAHG